MILYEQSLIFESKNNIVAINLNQSNEWLFTFPEN